MAGTAIPTTLLFYHAEKPCQECTQKPCTPYKVNKIKGFQGVHMLTTYDPLWGGRSIPPIETYVRNIRHVQLGVSLARNSRIKNETPLQSKGRTYRRAKPIFVSTLLITLKGILPLTTLAEPAVAAGLCPTPQQGASPLHPFLRSPLGKRSGVHPDRSALASLDRDASRSSRFRGRLRRTLTLHLSFSGKDRSSHDAAKRGARGTAGRSPRKKAEAPRWSYRGASLFLPYS